MNRATGLFLLSGLSLGACDKGTLTLVSPNEAFPARSVEIQIAGIGTMFGASTTVDLGDAAITTSGLSAGSDGNLRVTLEFAATARLGEHDVTVRTGDSTLTLSRGFRVVPSLKADGPSQLVQQGSLVPYAYLNLDYVENPLDQFTRLISGLTSVPGTNTVTEARMNGMALSDVLAPSGPVGAQAYSINPLQQYLTYVSDPADPGAPMLSSRATTPLSIGTAMANQSHPTPRSSNLYEFGTASADQVLLAQYSVLGTAFVGTNAPGILGALAPADGKFISGQFADSSSDGNIAPIRTMLAFLPVAGINYLATFPNNISGSTAHTYTLTVTTATATRLTLSESTTRDAGATPVAVIPSLTAAAPQVGIDGQIDDATDNDYIRYTASAGVTRVYVQLLAPGTTVQLNEYATTDCQGTSAAAINQSNVATLEVAAVQLPRCIRIRAPGALKYPYPYRVIVAAR